ncbi:MAG: hypothetical protein KKC20_06170, partial [Proteobacteria bacterium]|nr:hypothetical protein [Pseudomonadota bacterium]
METPVLKPVSGWKNLPPPTMPLWMTLFFTLAVTGPFTPWAEHLFTHGMKVFVQEAVTSVKNSRAHAPAWKMWFFVLVNRQGGRKKAMENP